MTLAGILAFLGLGAITMDVLGGVIATGILLRGGQLRHLLAFGGGYALVIIPVTALLHPLLTVLGTWLRPILHSNDAIGSIEVVAGLALGALAVHQWRSARTPPSAPGSPQQSQHAGPARDLAAVRRRPRVLDDRPRRSGVHPRGGHGRPGGVAPPADRASGAVAPRVPGAAR